MNLKDLKNKKILILGLGREGTDTYSFLRKLWPEKKLFLADKVEKKFADKNISLNLGQDYLKNLNQYDLIIKSPGISPRELKRAGFNDFEKVTSQTNIFFASCPGIIVGVTGTKGKSTTASLIHKILKKSHLIGNIGRPVLNYLARAKKNDIYVYELSSHQLSNIRFSPHIAVLLNIFPEHLDYSSFKDYIKAKSNITKYQTAEDYLIFNSGNKTVEEIAAKTKAQKIAFDRLTPRLKRNPLPGKFNLNNIKAAVAVGRIFNIPEEDISTAIADFKPLPHRLEFVGEHRGIGFYNDSLSTIPEAAIAALEALGDKTQTLILGGFDRGIDFKKLAGEIDESKIKTLILFPTSGERIRQEIKRKTIKHFPATNMKEAVALAYQCTDKGKICLLSCASPSFGLFKDYRDRGNQFKKNINER
ncbi:MAG: UDP-N-acetylmuramoyl-L-alanine--D-glutamate ligase [bacterium]